jgi:hypothetical protein
MMVTVSEHGSDRLKRRLGLPRKAHLRQVTRAWEDGIPAPSEKASMYYGGFVYLFSTTDGHPHLITVMPAREYEEELMDS